MPDFLSRFGQIDATGQPYFSNVRSGLIVGMVSSRLFALQIVANLRSSLLEL